MLRAMPPRFLVLLACCCCLGGRGNPFSVSAFAGSPTSSLSWHERKAQHKLKTLDAKGTQFVTALGAGQDDHFHKVVLAPFLRTRVPDTEGNRAVQQHIRSQMRGLGWTVEEDTFTARTPLGTKAFTNLIAVQNPAATRSLTLACHFDSKYFAEFEFIGATDSAVPCAMMIELARLLNPYFSKRQSGARDIALQLIFFDGEEAFEHWTATDSLYGSRHLADRMESSFLDVERELSITQLEAMDALVLLDLIGSTDTKFPKFFSKTSTLYDRLRAIEKRLSDAGLLAKGRDLFTGHSEQQMEGIGGIQDDHIPFLQLGVPVLHLISHPFPSVWHTERDNASAIDYAVVDRLSAILRVFVVEYLHLRV